MYNKNARPNQRRAINGGGIFRKAHHKSAWAKALYAAELSVRYPDLSATDLARLVGAKNAGYVRTSLKLLPGQKAAIHAGAATLSYFHHAPTDRVLLDTLRRCGLQRVCDAFDQVWGHLVAAE
jgi:hypothetical protein